MGPRKLGISLPQVRSVSAPSSAISLCVEFAPGVNDVAIAQALLKEHHDEIAEILSQETGKTFEDEDTTEDDAREEYMRLAERRVRLGLVLSEIGEQ